MVHLWSSFESNIGRPLPLGQRPFEFWVEKGNLTTPNKPANTRSPTSGGRSQAKSVERHGGTLTFGPEPVSSPWAEPVQVIRKCRQYYRPIVLLIVFWH
jgi:hypothetical protein